MVGLTHATSNYFPGRLVVDPVPYPDYLNVSAAMVAAGTSRALVLSGEDLGSVPPERAILNLMQGHGEGAGLMANHYQGNKVAIIRPAPFPNGFLFNFFQFDKARGRVLANMECSNVAAGCAAYALMSGLVAPGDESTLLGVNESTGQHIALIPSDSTAPWRTDWCVRFLQENFNTQSIPLEACRLCSSEGQEVEYWALERGNAFIFAGIGPDDTDPALIDALSHYGGRAVEVGGGAPQKAMAPKVLLYSIESVESNVACLDVTCYFLGEQHKSLPGSGVMTLAGFLTLTYLTTVRPMAQNGVFGFRMRHPSGVLFVAAHWKREGEHYSISATEFTTPVSLILAGVIFLDRHFDENL